MDDKRIIELFFERDEAALKETSEKYGAYCRYIAGNILPSAQDSEECFADALAAAWNSIPPEKPESLKAYIGRITRNLALNSLKAINAAKRGGGTVGEALEELGECAAPGSVEGALDAGEMKRSIDGFVRSLPEKHRRAFVMRYWYLCTPEQISKQLGMTVDSVNVTLHRVRARLREYLKREGYDL